MYLYKLLVFLLILKLIHGFYPKIDKISIRGNIFVILSDYVPIQFKSLDDNDIYAYVKNDNELIISQSNDNELYGDTILQHIVNDKGKDHIIYEQRYNSITNITTTFKYLNYINDFYLAGYYVKNDNELIISQSNDNELYGDTILQHIVNDKGKDHIIYEQRYNSITNITTTFKYLNYINDCYLAGYNVKNLEMYDNSKLVINENYFFLELNIRMYNSSKLDIKTKLYLYTININIYDNVQVNFNFHFVQNLNCIANDNSIIKNFIIVGYSGIISNGNSSINGYKESWCRTFEYQNDNGKLIINSISCKKSRNLRDVHHTNFKKYNNRK